MIIFYPSDLTFFTGEFESFLHEKRQCKVVCKTWSEFYVINICDILAILNSYFTPNQAQKKWNSIQKYIKKSKDEKSLHSIELAQSRYISPKSIQNDSQYHKQFIHLFSKNKPKHKPLQSNSRQPKPSYSELIITGNEPKRTGRRRARTKSETRNDETPVRWI